MLMNINTSDINFRANYVKFTTSERIFQEFEISINKLKKLGIKAGKNSDEFVKINQEIETLKKRRTNVLFTNKYMCSPYIKEKLFALRLNDKVTLNPLKAQLEYHPCTKRSLNICEKLSDDEKDDILHYSFNCDDVNIDKLGINNWLKKLSKYFTFTPVRIK